MILLQVYFIRLAIKGEGKGIIYGIVKHGG